MSAFAMSFDVSTYSAEGSYGPSYEIGESYNARIGAIIPCETSYKNEEKKQGFVLAILIADGNGNLSWRQSNFIGLEKNIFFEKASYAILMQGLLKTPLTGAELKDKVLESPYKNLAALVDVPCVVTMKSKVSDGKEYWNIKEIRGASNSFKGLQNFDGCPLNLNKVLSKFITRFEGEVIANGVTIDNTPVQQAVDTAAMNDNSVENHLF